MEMPSDGLMLDIAMEYLDRGFSVIPLTPGNKTPHMGLLPRNSDGKPSWKCFQDRLPTGDEVSGWFQTESGANLGIVTGQISGVVVQDIDEDAGLAEAHRQGGIPDTPISQTGHGIHVFYQHPGYQVSNFCRRLPGMDLRGDGGYVVAPPSLHPDGHRYRWQVDLKTPFAPAPDWLVEAWTPDNTAEIVREALEGPPMAITSGRYGEVALRSELERLLKATNGSRNNMLVKGAFRMGQLIAEGRLTEEEVVQQMKLVAMQIGLPEREVDATLASGLNAGKRNKRR